MIKQRRSIKYALEYAFTFLFHTFGGETDDAFLVKSRAKDAKIAKQAPSLLLLIIEQHKNIEGRIITNLFIFKLFQSDYIKLSCTSLYDD